MSQPSRIIVTAYGHNPDNNCSYFLSDWANISLELQRRASKRTIISIFSHDFSLFPRYMKFVKSSCIFEPLHPWFAQQGNTYVSGSCSDLEHFWPQYYVQNHILSTCIVCKHDISKCWAFLANPNKHIILHFLMSRKHPFQTPKSILKRALQRFILVQSSQQLIGHFADN